MNIKRGGCSIKTNDTNVRPRLKCKERHGDNCSEILVGNAETTVPPGSIGSI